MLPVFGVNSLFFLKCNQLCEFFLKNFYFPFESIQGALKNKKHMTKKNTHDKLKGQKGYYN